MTRNIRENPTKELSEPRRTLSQEREYRKQRVAASEARRQLEAAIKHIDHLESQVDTLLALDEPKNIIEWQRQKAATLGEATAVFLWSDWHVEQVILPGEVNGLNRWGPKYAEAARVKYVQSVQETILPRYRLGAKIDEAVIWIGGDFLEGHHRDEQKTRNAMTPIRAAQFAEELLEQTIRDFLSIGDFKRITVVTSTGNHDRTTEKTWASARNDTSFATLIYDHLRKIFRTEKRIQWQSEQGEVSYLKVYDYECRFLHGDMIRYRGGRDGLTLAANITIQKLNASRDADYTFFGDKHTFIWSDQGGFVGNGALCGQAPYGLRYGANRPCQAVAIIDRKHGLTDATKVFCR